MLELIALASYGYDAVAPGETKEITGGAPWAGMLAFGGDVTFAAGCIAAKGIAAPAATQTLPEGTIVPWPLLTVSVDAGSTGTLYMVRSDEKSVSQTP